MKKDIKKYVLKCNIPGGYKKGDTVELMFSEWRWNKNNTLCFCEPNKETEFFAPVIEPFFKNGTQVYLKEPYKSRDINVNTNKPVIVISSTLNRFNKMNYTLDCYGKTITITEDKLYIPEVYWFINSKGKICSQIKTTEHMNSFEYKFKKLRNNVFNSIDDARKVVAEITEIIFNGNKVETVGKVTKKGGKKLETIK